MPDLLETKAKKKLKLPAGNADVLRCENGCIYIVGWAIFKVAKFKQAKVFLCPEGMPRIEVPVAPIRRVDVSEYLGISKDVVTGFSVLISLDRFSIEDLPSGLTDVVFADPDMLKPDIHAGKIDIQWPDQFLSVTPKMKLSGDNAPRYKPPGFFKKLWRGELGANPSIAPLLDNAGPLTATAILDSLRLIQDRPKLALSIHKSQALRAARSLNAASKNRGLIIVFDHDFGGGANSHSRALVTEHLIGNNEVLRIWYQLDQTTFRAAYFTAQETYEFDVGGVSDVFKLCTEFPSFAIQVNSLWGYPHIGDILDNLVRLKLYDFTERMEYFAHDHMGICPSLFLLNENHKYCAVPKSTKTCDKCLKNNTQEFKVFFHENDVSVWRTNWRSFFLNCDAMRFFSNSTLSHYIKAHPWLKDHPNTIVAGHEVKDIWAEKVLPRAGKSDGLNIGVFGFINFHKGSDVVNAIAARIEETGDNAKIFVFGALDGKSYGSHGAIELMGSYTPKDMAQHCDENEIDLAIVPSICPETFSITTKELMLINIPVVTFDLGAQAELVKGYDKGHVISLRGKTPVFDRLKKIKEKF